jgi:hypothetical protein
VPAGEFEFSKIPFYIYCNIKACRYTLVHYDNYLKYPRKKMLWRARVLAQTALPKYTIKASMSRG